MFSGCSSLISLPEISKWNTKNVINIRDIFSGCLSLICLPGIKQLKDGYELKYLPDDS